MSAHYVEAEDRDLAVQFGATRYVSRTEGFDAVVRAVLEAIDAPPGELPSPGAGDVGDRQAEYLRRIAHQLERQASLGVGLARRVSVQASALSVLDSLSDSLARQLDPESALGDLLAECLDAAGLSMGAILLRTDDADRLALRASVGADLVDDWRRYGEILEHAIVRGGVVLPSRDCEAPAKALLEQLGAASVLIVPITARDEALGVLLLASTGTELAGAEESFGRAARSVSMQLGQALALSRMFARLGAAEQRYRALFEHARDAIAVLSPSGTIVEANRGWEEILGTKRANIEGHHIGEFATAERQPTVRSDFETAVERGESALIPALALKRADGSTVHVEMSRTIVDLGGERYVLSIGRDVSERLRLEDQLRQSQKMEAVGRLAGGIAHDFNNLLSVVLSCGEMLLEDMKPGDPMREDVEEIRKAGKRAADLTRQLLMFTRQQVIEPRVLDLNEVLTGMEKMLQRLLGADVDLLTLPAPHLGRVRVDPGSIEQVIMNLVVNARDAMPTGGKLTLETANVVLDEEHARAHPGTKPGPHVMLAVTDTGMGMDKATIHRIFEPFFTTKEKGKGTGLGLSTVFGIAQQSGGSVWAYSEVGKGTVFKVYLPRVDAAIDRTRPSLAAPMLHGSETILLVEDNDEVRAVARGALLRYGYKVIEARNAGEALLHAAEPSVAIDMLLTDVVMPQMSGPELAKRLAPGRPGMKVLCMSGYTDDSIVRHGVLSAEIAFLQKPITPEALMTKVRDVLDAGKPAHTSDEHA
jgi:PAS domain S-box-containing protein